MKKQKNIVIVYPTLPRYRADFFNLLNSQFRKTGKNLVLLAGINTIAKEIKEIDNPNKYIMIRSERVGFSLFGYQVEWHKDLLSNIIKQRPEKVIFMFSAGIINYSILMLYLYFRRVPFFIWGSGHKRMGLSALQQKFKDIFKSYFINKSSGYITYSQYYARMLKKEGYKKKIICAQNTINIEDIINSAEKQEYKRNYNIINFLFVGAIIPYKKLDLAIRACKKLKDENYKFRFDIIGDGNIKKDLINLVNDLVLGNHVFLHGAKYGLEVAKFFRSANVFVLPGTGGLAINEAMAYSLPIITTPGDGTAYDLIADGENGFLLDYDYDTSELYKRMKFFFNCKNEKLINMEKKSLKIIRNKATLENMVNKFIDCIVD
jgi:glycosyltransferase involved in cell wall biosynthesis